MKEISLAPAKYLYQIPAFESCEEECRTSVSKTRGEGVAWPKHPLIFVFLHQSQSLKMHNDVTEMENGFKMLEMES